jgi:hypothetical protein
MFVAKDQEYTDIHTGITIAFGEHYQNVDVPAGSPGSPAGRLSWLRISVPADGDKPAKIATLQLSNGQIVRSDKHEVVVDQSPVVAGTVEVLPEEQPVEEVPVEGEEVAHKKKRRY